MQESWNRGVLSPLEFHSRSGKIIYAVIVAALLIFALTVVMPFIYAFTAGLKQPKEIYTSGLQLWPDAPNWESYAIAWNDFDLPRFFGNTLLVVGGGIFSQIAVSTLAAYSLSRLKPVGGRFVLMGFLMTLMIPSMAYLIPLYVTTARIEIPSLDFKLLGSYWGLWLPYGVNAFMIFVMKSFFDGLPNELFDAAKVDGASPLQMFWLVALPLTRPILIVQVILTFVNLWKDFIWPMLVLLREPRIQPITVRLYLLNEATPYPINQQMAAYFLAMMPPLLIAVVLQRYMQRGLTVGAVKG